MLKHIKIATLTLGCLALTSSLASLRAQVTTERPAETTQPKTTPTETPPAQTTTAAPKIELDQSSPVSTLRSIATSTAGGQPVAVFGAIAPADRQRIDAMLHGLAAKVDVALYDDAAGMLKQLGGIIKQNIKFIANNPQLGGGAEPADVERRWTGFAATLDSLTSSALGSHQGLASFSIDTFMGGKGAELLAQLMTLSKDPESGVKLPDFATVEFGEPEIDGDVATVEVKSEEGSEVVQLKRVDDKWYLNLDEPLEEAETGISEMPKMEPQEAMQIRGPMKMMVGGALQQFSKVETQEDFDDQVATLTQTFMGMMMGMGGGMGR